MYLATRAMPLLILLLGILLQPLLTDSLLNSTVNWGKLFNLSNPYFCIYEFDIKNTYFIAFLGILNNMRHEKGITVL